MRLTTLLVVVLLSAVTPLAHAAHKGTGKPASKSALVSPSNHSAKAKAEADDAPPASAKKKLSATKKSLAVDSASAGKTKNSQVQYPCKSRHSKCSAVADKAQDADSAAPKATGKRSKSNSAEASAPAVHCSTHDRKCKAAQSVVQTQDADSAAPKATGKRSKSNTAEASAPAVHCSPRDRKCKAALARANADEAPKLTNKRGSRRAVADPDAMPQMACRRTRRGRPVACKVSASLPRAIFQPTPLRGSYESLVRQNVKTEDDGLERIIDDKDLDARIARGVLIPVPVSNSLAINPTLPENRRYCRPWTASFLADLARDHEAEFHRPLLVSSAVRTVEYQRKLQRTNGNAASAEGDIASPHLTGATIDIVKQGMNRRELTWMRDHLLPIQQSGHIDVEEEFRQACFHITVYKSYNGQDSNDETGDHPGAIPARLAPEAPMPQLPADSAAQREGTSHPRS